MGDGQWKIIDTGTSSAEHNMQEDKKFIENLHREQTPGILHFYDWARPSATYGYFVNPSERLSLEETSKMGIDLARRPTGGGVLFHIWDYAFSVLIPTGSPCYYENTLDSYAFVNQTVLEAIRPLLGEANPPEILEKGDAPTANASCSHFCMARPTRYDVLAGGKKIIGAAQRRMKQGILHQGTISLVMPDEEVLERALSKNLAIKEAMISCTFALLGKEATPLQVAQARLEIKELIIKAFQSIL